MYPVLLSACGLELVLPNTAYTGAPKEPLSHKTIASKPTQMLHRNTVKNNELWLSLRCVSFFFLSTPFLLILVIQPLLIKCPTVLHKLARPKILFSVDATKPGLATVKFSKTPGELDRLLRVTIRDCASFTCPRRG